MEELKVLRRGEDLAGPGAAQSRRRRASAITVRIQTRPFLADPPSSPQARKSRDVPSDASPAFPEPAGCLLIVQDPGEERQVLLRTARLAGLQVLQAKNSVETLRILEEKDFPVDLLLVISHPAISPSAAALIRKSLEIRPGLQVLMMMDPGQRENMRAGYAAGASSIILHGMTPEALSTFLQRSLSSAREGRRQELRRRERSERHASDSAMRRGIRKIGSWIDALTSGRRKTGLGAMAAGALALLIGMGLASALERSYRAGDRADAMTNRLLEGMNRSRTSTYPREAAILYGQTREQIGLAREANEATRRYQQEHLQELRWQNYSRSNTPSNQPANLRE